MAINLPTFFCECHWFQQTEASHVSNMKQIQEDPMFQILLILAVVWAVIAAGGGSLFKINTRSKHSGLDVFIQLFVAILLLSLLGF